MIGIPIIDGSDNSSKKSIGLFGRWYSRYRLTASNGQLSVTGGGGGGSSTFVGLSILQVVFLIKGVNI